MARPYWSFLAFSALLVTGCHPAGDDSPTGDNNAELSSTISFQNGVAPSSSYAGVKDTEIVENSPNTNDGSATSLIADGDDPAGTGKDNSVLVKWDVSAIPAGSTIQSATITVYITNTGATFPVYPLKRPWVDQQATWTNYASQTPWQIAGAKGDLDRSTTVIGSISGAASGQTTSTLNSAGVALIQSWVNDRTQNFGVIVADTSLTGSTGFASSEDGTASHRPRLTVTYTTSSTTSTPDAGTTTSSGGTTPSVTPTPSGCPVESDPTRSFPSDYSTRLSQLKQRLPNIIKQLDSALSSGVVSPQGLMRGALILLATGGGSLDSQQHAEKYMNYVFAHQNSDGTFPWIIGKSTVDANATLFALEPLGPIFKRYGGCLTDSFKSNAIPHIKSALTALMNNPRSTNYTNAFLGTAVDKLLLGEVVQNSTVASSGQADLDSWINYTKGAGITEADSPDYYGVDVRSLEMGYLFTSSSTAKGKLQSMLDYFYRDIGANIFGGRDSLSGPHERDYKVLLGHDQLDWTTYLNGWTNALPAYSDHGLAMYLENELARGYQPSLDSLLKGQNHVVKSWFGPSNGAGGRQRYNYVTQDFELGSASADCTYAVPYCIDKVLTAELPVGANNPIVNAVIDDTNNPYVLPGDVAGHLKNHPVISQSNGFALAQFSVQPPRGMPTVATNVTFPVKGVDQLLVDGNPVSTTQTTSWSIPVNLRSVVALKSGSGAVAFSIYAASGCGSFSPTVSVKGDGLSNGAARLVVYHWNSSSNVSTSCHARAGIVMATQSVSSSTAFTDFVASFKNMVTSLQDNFDGTTWSSSATLSSTKLDVSRNWSTGAINYRRVNGSDMTFPFGLSVNDVNVRPAAFH